MGKRTSHDAYDPNDSGPAAVDRIPAEPPAGLTGPTGVSAPTALGAPTGPTALSSRPISGPAGAGERR